MCDCSPQRVSGRQHTRLLHIAVVTGLAGVMWLCATAVQTFLGCTHVMRLLLVTVVTVHSIYGTATTTHVQKLCRYSAGYEGYKHYLGLLTSMLVGSLTCVT